MKTKGMSHQLKGLEVSDGKRNFAFLAEQGCGKSWMALADTERCYEAGKIEALVVIAPNGVHTNWTRREIPTHLSVSSTTFTWRGNIKTKKAKDAFAAIWKKMLRRDSLVVLSINIDALQHEAGYELTRQFLLEFKCMMVMDESTRIKNPKAKRTEKVIELGKFAVARRILSGTPITKGPIDLFSQFDFLKTGLLGTTSYRAFVAEYAVLLRPGDKRLEAIMRKTGGRGTPQVVETDINGQKIWKNLDKLAEMIAPHSYRVRKADCLDLPPKVYQSVYFDLDADQRRVYDDLKDDYYYDDDGFDMTFEAIATRTKLKQVTSGFIKINGELRLVESDQATTPRMKAFKDTIEDIDGQFIVWAMFEEEINQIMAALADAGISAASYYGGTPQAQRDQIIDDFQAGKITAFVGHAAAAGIGITLTAAQTALYYSCSFDNELRLQSEDRNHRIGTKGTVTYIDFVAEDTIDEDVVKSLAAKNLVAFEVLDKKR